jgi:hypothetical protein
MCSALQIFSRYLNEVEASNMGALITTTWYVYARDTNDKWLEDPLHSTVAKEDDEKHHIGMFKHRTFQFALGQEHSNCYKLYLYHGWRRIKVQREPTSLTVFFSDSAAKDAWDNCRRPKIGKQFYKKWSLEASKSLEYVFQNKSMCEVLKSK